MLIALAQQNYIIGDFEGNFVKIKNIIEKSKNLDVDLVIFSELAICGYPPHDLLEHQNFVNTAIYYIHQIASITQNISLIIGGPSFNDSPSGKALFNSAYFINNGKIISIHHKTLLPTYDVFDEYRYFESNKSFNLVSLKNKKFAITICEDLWDNPPVEYAFGRSKLYNISPIKKLMQQGKPDFIVNIAASPFEYNKIQTKKNIFTNYAKDLNIPILYVNQVGANTDLIFDGGSFIVNANGQIVELLNFFEEDFRIIKLDDIEIKRSITIMYDNTIEQIYNALIIGLRDYFHKSGFKKAILGLSGGIDSAVATVIAVKALGASNVDVLLMPSKYSSEHSVSDAIELAQKLNINYHIIPIQQTVDSIELLLKPLFQNIEPDTTEENIQARVRGIMLMAMSNKFGSILLNTSNKSEIAVGYGTLYGDMNGGLSVLGDVYKTDVYRLAQYINRTEEIIPKNILIKAPSAELRPNQKDQDSLPPYEILDNILFQYIEQQKNLEEIASEGFDKEIVQKTIRMVNSNEYKRYQAPPILKVSSKCFGHGRRMPIVARYN